MARVKVLNLEKALFENRFELLKGLLFAVAFAVLQAVAAKIEIPASPVPFTFQTTVVILSGIMLGARGGFLTQIIYLSLGIAGVPVFTHQTNFVMGFATLLSPTGGYLLAFPIAAYLSGSYMNKNTSVLGLSARFIIGELVIFTSGVLFLNAFYIHNISQSFMLGAVPFIGWTLAKSIIGIGSAKAFSKFGK